MRLSLGLILGLASLVAMTGCGRVSDPQRPPGSPTPLVYPSTSMGKQGAPITPPVQQQPVANFSAGGSYIDPSTRVQQIYGQSAPLGLTSDIPGGRYIEPLSRAPAPSDSTSSTTETDQ